MQNNFWEEVDLDSTIKDFEFTRRAVRSMNNVVYSASFEDMDSQAILSYLIGEMEMVSFKDFLKRYIYARAGMDIPFKDVPDDVYRDIIMESFQENAAPHFFTPTSKRWSAIVKGWLTQNSVKRDTIFLLGFGLKMSENDVSRFLTKAIQEEDFRRNSPQEVVYWYCYHNGYRYAKAVNLLAQAREAGQIKFQKLYRTGNAIDQGYEADIDLTKAGDQDVVRYVAGLFSHADSDSGEQNAYSIFMDLMGQTKETIADIYQQDEQERGGKKQWTGADITSADIEKVISCGIPVTGSGNLKKASLSALATQFHQKRLTRQRLDGVAGHQYEPDRFDLITLLFFIYSQKQIDLEPEIRCRNFIDEANRLLR